MSNNNDFIDINAIEDHNNLEINDDSSFVDINNKLNHDFSCSCMNDFIECTFCEGIFEKSFYNNTHKILCGKVRENIVIKNDQYLCKNCEKFIKIIDTKAHSKDCKSKKNNNNNFFLVNNKNSSNDNKDSHMANCSYCKLKISFEQLNDHELKCSIQQTEKLLMKEKQICRKCKNTFSTYQFEEHIKNCKKLEKENMLLNKDLEDLHTSFPKIWRENIHKVEYPGEEYNIASIFKKSAEYGSIADNFTKLLKDIKNDYHLKYYKGKPVQVTIKNISVSNIRKIRNCKLYSQFKASIEKKKNLIEIFKANNRKKFNYKNTTFNQKHMMFFSHVLSDNIEDLHNYYNMNESKDNKLLVHYNKLENNPALQNNLNLNMDIRYLYKYGVNKNISTTPKILNNENKLNEMKNYANVNKHFKGRSIYLGSSNYCGFYTHAHKLSHNIINNLVVNKREFFDNHIGNPNEYVHKDKKIYVSICEVYTGFALNKNKKSADEEFYNTAPTVNNLQNHDSTWHYNNEVLCAFESDLVYPFYEIELTVDCVFDERVQTEQIDYIRNNNKLDPYNEFVHGSKDEELFFSYYM